MDKEKAAREDTASSEQQSVASVAAESTPGIATNAAVVESNVGTTPSKPVVEAAKAPEVVGTPVATDDFKKSEYFNLAILAYF